MKLAVPIYLDYAAATPMADFVVEAMMPYFTEHFYNPSSPYFAAVTVRRDYEAAKQTIARTIGAKGDELIMTAGATESINLAFRQASGHIVTTQIEHPAVLETAKRQPHTLVSVNEKGRVAVESVRAAIREDTELVSIGLANSELGTLQPIRKIAQMITQVRQARREKGNTTPLFFHSDASQGFGLVDIHVARLGVDLLTLNAAKIYGPKQVGLLWVNASIDMQPEIIGGGQERGLRSGTENVAGVIGFAAAAERASATQKSEADRLVGLRNHMQQRFVDAFDDVVLLGDAKYRLPSHLSVAFPRIDAERVIFAIEDRVLIATGSACSANKHTASHVLRAIQLDDTCISGSLRITLGAQTDEAAITTAADTIIEAIEHEYSRMNKR